MFFGQELLQKVHYVNFRTNVRLLRKTKYGGKFTVTMIPGKDFGSHLMTHVKDIFECAKVPVEFEVLSGYRNQSEEDVLHAIITSIKRNGVAIKGNINPKHWDHQVQSRNVILRQKLDLFANVLHCKSQPGIRIRHNNVDLVLIRQNTEGEYSCLEHKTVPGVVESLKIVTAVRSEEISRFAFQYAIQENRKKITAVHMANVMKLSDGLFLDACNKIAEEYPQIKFDAMLLNTCSHMLVTKPQEFDVLLLTNLYGNILNNIACGLVGGAGVVSGQNYGHDCAVFEIGSRNSVISDNPVPMIKASVDLLYYIGLERYAKVIRDSVHKTFNINRILTPDLGGTGDVLDVVRHIKKVIQEESSTNDL